MMGGWVTVGDGSGQGGQVWGGQRAFRTGGDRSHRIQLIQEGPLRVGVGDRLGDDGRVTMDG